MGEQGGVGKHLHRGRDGDGGVKPHSFAESFRKGDRKGRRILRPGNRKGHWKTPCGKLPGYLGLARGAGAREVDLGADPLP
jgi:hypothetical protein